jgi:hypothetical protein
MDTLLPEKDAFNKPCTVQGKKFNLTFLQPSLLHTVKKPPCSLYFFVLPSNLVIVPSVFMTRGEESEEQMPSFNLKPELKSKVY